MEKSWNGTNECEIKLKLTWSTSYIISAATGATIFVIANTKLYFPVVTLSTQGNAELLQQVKSGFNWNEYLSKVLNELKTII